jgi:hypothetical protein
LHANTLLRENLAFWKTYSCQVAIENTGDGEKRLVVESLYQLVLIFIIEVEN